MAGSKTAPVEFKATGIRPGLHDVVRDANPVEVDVATPESIVQVGRDRL